jgi:hypothetical protein
VIARGIVNLVPGALTTFLQRCLDPRKAVQAGAAPQASQVPCARGAGAAKPSNATCQLPSRLPTWRHVGAATVTARVRDSLRNTTNTDSCGASFSGTTVDLPSLR